MRFSYLPSKKLFSGILFIGICFYSIADNVEVTLGADNAKVKESHQKAIPEKSINIFEAPSNKIDFNEQNIQYIPLEDLKSDKIFKEGLNPNQYSILIRSWLKEKYPSAFDNNAWSTYYFIRALGENTYSTNGVLRSEIFNNINKGRNEFFKINKTVSDLDVNQEIKYALSKLYAAVCIYVRLDNTLIKNSIVKIKKIPKNSVLFQVASRNNEVFYNPNFSVELKSDKQTFKDDSSLGDYVATDAGENLYYICASYYPIFVSLSEKQQQYILNDIFSYNPTLIDTPSIYERYYFYDYIKNWLFPKKNPPLLKYSLEAHVNWLILPESLEVPNN